MGGASRRLEGRKNEMELNTFEFVVHFLVGCRLVVVVFLCGGPQLLSGGPLPKLQIFLTFGNTSFICAVNLEYTLPTVASPGGLWPVGFPQLATSLYATSLKHAICFRP